MTRESISASRKEERFHRHFIGLEAYVQSTAAEELHIIDIAKMLVPSEKIYAYIEAANKKAGSRSPWG